VGQLRSRRHLSVCGELRAIDCQQGVATLTFQSSCNPGVQTEACDRVMTDKNGFATDMSTHAQLRASEILTDKTGDISKLVSLAALATNNLPSPSYTEIIANVTACVPKP
jgi:hypothetical protein